LEQLHKAKAPFVDETRWVTLSRESCDPAEFREEVKDYKRGDAAFADVTLPDDHPYRDAQSWTTYVIDPKGFLQYLTQRVRSLGGKILKNKVDRIKDLETQYDVVINCKGVAAHEDDPNVYPTYGMVILSELPTLNSTSILDEDTGGYILTFPGKPCVEVGGIVVPDRWERKPDEKYRKWIMENTRTFVTEEILIEDEWCGLRPTRHGGPRVDITPGTRIVNCFGFGGAGYLMSYGYARDVVDLVGTIVSPRVKVRSRL